jgi:hypothetical protein
VGSEVAVAEPAVAEPAADQPAADDGPEAPGVWSEEQVEAFRARLREVTTTVVDRAAGAVIGTVNTLAAAIRSRTSSRRGDDNRS